VHRVAVFPLEICKGYRLPAGNTTDSRGDKSCVQKTKAQNPFSPHADFRLNFLVCYRQALDREKNPLSFDLFTLFSGLKLIPEKKSEVLASF
jgi:hypothetical protein